MQSCNALKALLACLGAGTAAHSQAVLEVGGPSPDHADIQSAIDAAADGDVVLVHPGTYPEMVIDGRGLTIQAAEPGTVLIDAADDLDRMIAVTNVPAGKSVRLRGLRFREEFEHGVCPTIFQCTVDEGAGLRLVDNVGTIWVEQCASLYTIDQYPSLPGLHVENCQNVVLIDSVFFGQHVQCTARGAFFGYSYYANGPGMLVLGNSRVHAYQCHFYGANGVPVYQIPSSCESGTFIDADPGIKIEDGFVFLSGCTSNGGRGWATSIGCQYIGSAPSVINNGGALVSLDSSLVGFETGTFDDPFVGPCFEPGAPPTVGQIDRLSGRSMKFATSSPIESGAQTTLTFDGPRFTAVFLALDTDVNPVFSLLVSGSYLLTSDADLEFAGFTDEDGHLELTGPTPPVPGGSFVTFSQPIYVDLNVYPAIPGATSDLARRGGRLFVGPGSMTVALGASH